MQPSPAAPFTRRTATILLAAALVLFVVGVVSLAVGWAEVATACAAVFAVGWLGMRARAKRIAAQREAARREAAEAEAARPDPRPEGRTVRSRRAERRRRRP
ncbi:MAG: hypothetical protein AB1416_08710 [Actinomycetota bacterium]